jgi:hypothetical protein
MSDEIEADAGTEYDACATLDELLSHRYPEASVTARREAACYTPFAALSIEVPSGIEGQPPKGKHVAAFAQRGGFGVTDERVMLNAQTRAKASGRVVAVASGLPPVGALVRPAPKLEGRPRKLQAAIRAMAEGKPLPEGLHPVAARAVEWAVGGALDSLGRGDLRARAQIKLLLADGRHEVAVNVARAVLGTLTAVLSWSVRVEHGLTEPALADLIVRVATPATYGGALGGPWLATLRYDGQAGTFSAGPGWDLGVLHLLVASLLGEAEYAAEDGAQIFAYARSLLAACALDERGAVILWPAATPAFARQGEGLAVSARWVDGEGAPQAFKGLVQGADIFEPVSEHDALYQNVCAVEGGAYADLGLQRAEIIQAPTAEQRERWERGDKGVLLEIRATAKPQLYLPPDLAWAARGTGHLVGASLPPAQHVVRGLIEGRPQDTPLTVFAGDGQGLFPPRG